MKIRITEPGWAGYTGLLGAVEFIDGVSADEVSRADASQLSAIVAVENVATGKSPSAAQMILDNYGLEAAVVSDVTGADAAPVPVSPVAHTKESLEGVADKSGIKGLRDIAEPLGVRGTAITELIEKILGVGNLATADIAVDTPSIKATAGAVADKSSE